MIIEILYFEGCPHYEPAVELTERALQKLSTEADIIRTEVTTPEQAARLRFLGSPSIRVDGIDVQPGADARTDFGLCCRTYDGKGTPSEDAVCTAIRSAAPGLQDFPGIAELKDAFNAKAGTPRMIVLLSPT